MKVLYLSNNEISVKLFKWLKKVEKDVTWYSEPVSLEHLWKLNPDWIISYNYRHLICKEVIGYMKQRVINLHISLLPWNRGASPNLWSFLDDTPKGVSIHYVDEGLDTGAILVQKEMFFDEKVETLQSSYNKLHDEIYQLFSKNWDKIKKFQFIPKLQESGGGWKLS